MNHPPLVRLEGLSRRFHGVRALDGVSFDILPGEIQALVGANGAGKSTLVHMLVGLQQPDDGRILLDGLPVRFSGPAAARARGIDAVFQETHLPPNLPVAEAMFLGREPCRWGFIDDGQLYGAAASTLRRLGVSLNPRTLVEELSVANKQVVQIARALTGQPRLMVLDEPTSALTDHEIERLMGLLEGLRTAGVALLYVSHKLGEIERLADRVTVLRDGRHVGTILREEVSARRLVAMMADPAAADEAEAESGLETRTDAPSPAGTAAAAAEEAAGPAPAGTPVLRVEGLSSERRFAGIGFSLRAGEVLGLFGIVGSGRTEVARAIFGLDPFDGGRIELAGRAVRFRSPADAVRAGLGLVPEDRKQQGLVMGMSLRRNLSLAALPLLQRFGFILPRAEQRLGEDLVANLGVVCASLEQEAQSLSGGNQQKLVIGKWLAARPRVLILDEPTRGIDVAAKAEVHALVRRLAAAGMAVLLISSELGEVLHVADRILVMRSGRIRGELNRSQATHARAIQLATED